jgi:hypothetical protein
MVGREGERTTANYAFHYRMASQTVHGGVLGMRDVIQESGIRFDGREANPNLALLFLASYLLPFLQVLDHVFKLKRATELASFKSRYDTISKRILASVTAAGKKGP